LEDGDIHKVLDCPAAELTKKDLVQVTAVCEVYDEDFEAVVERPQLATSVLKKGIQMSDNLGHFFEVNHCMVRCLKFKHDMEDVNTIGGV
jgi:hypothetical protein